MTRRMIKLVAFMAVFGVFIDAAHAISFPSLQFAFANSALQGAFLFPFRLLGCG